MGNCTGLFSACQ
jgi:hypothetical protein